MNLLQADHFPALWPAFRDTRAEPMNKPWHSGQRLCAKNTGFIKLKQFLDRMLDLPNHDLPLKIRQHLFIETDFGGPPRNRLHRVNFILQLQQRIK